MTSSISSLGAEASETDCPVFIHRSKEGPLAACMQDVGGVTHRRRDIVGNHDDSHALPVEPLDQRIHLVDDYDLNYYAAFAGCSAESEASFETIVFLAGKVDELGLSAVLTIEGDNHRIAETIVGNTQAKDAKVLALDSLQATTGEDAENGATYLGVMEANLKVLEQALAK